MHLLIRNTYAYSFDGEKVQIISSDFFKPLSLDLLSLIIWTAWDKSASSPSSSSMIQFHSQRAKAENFISVPVISNPPAKCALQLVNIFT